MKKNLLLKLFNLAGVIALVLGYAACANRGQGPQGGPKDELGPVVLLTEPINGATNVNKNYVIIHFDELVSLENPGQNIIISPPQKEPPTFKVKGKKIAILFEDTLLANTTYTIDFRNSIVDINEKNPLKDYSFHFSTGSHIDSLQISGHVIDAFSLKPRANYSVGVYRNSNDSAFLTRRFDRIAKTDENGDFTLKNLAAGSYKLYALNDVAQSNYYAQKGTEMAFYDSIITPEAHLHATIDTLWSNPEKTKFDSLLVDAFYKYLPEDLILRTFREKDTLHFLKKSIRSQKGQFLLVFNEPQPEQPIIRLLEDSAKVDSTWYYQEHLERADSLVFWLKDSSLIQQDTLKLIVSYLYTDTAHQNVRQEDTLYLKERVKYQKKKKKQKSNKDSLLYTFKHNMARELEVYDTIQLLFPEPISSCNTDSIHFYQVIDTLEKEIPLFLKYNYDPCPTKLYLIFKKEFGEKYQLRMDSAAVTSWYGKGTNTFNKPIRVKSLEEYSNLYMQILNPPAHAVVQLLTNRGEVVLESEIIDGEAYFEDVQPDTYYVRMYIDENQNQHWDTGNYEKKKQAEPSYYFPASIRLRANWDVEEVWDYKVLPLNEQLPQELKTSK